MAPLRRAVPSRANRTVRFRAKGASRIGQWLVDAANRARRLGAAYLCGDKAQRSKKGTEMEATRSTS